MTIPKQRSAKNLAKRHGPATALGAVCLGLGGMVLATSSAPTSMAEGQVAAEDAPGLSTSSFDTATVEGRARIAGALIAGGLTPELIALRGLDAASTVGAAGAAFITEEAAQRTRGVELTAALRRFEDATALAGWLEEASRTSTSASLNPVTDAEVENAQAAHLSARAAYDSALAGPVLAGLSAVGGAPAQSELDDIRRAKIIRNGIETAVRLGEDLDERQRAMLQEHSALLAALDRADAQGFDQAWQSFAEGGE